MGDQSPPWPKQGPASYFPSIEKNHGRSIAEWQQVMAECGFEKHMAIVGYLKSEHHMGHGHANALVGWTLAGNAAAAPWNAAAATDHQLPDGYTGGKPLKLENPAPSTSRHCHRSVPWAVIRPELRSAA